MPRYKTISGGVIQRAGQRRKTKWFQGLESAAFTNIAANSLVFQQGLSGTLNDAPFTAVRTRGILAVGSDQEAADEFQHVMFGQAVISDQAVAIGVTAMPTPRTDSGSDLFFVFEFIANDFRFGDATGFVTGVQERVIDSRAMRKVEDGQDVISVIEAGVVGQGSSVQTFTRLLVKLH